ncbi:MAG: ABC transporter substrate-binding protein [Ignisphaera sp.]
MVGKYTYIGIGVLIIVIVVAIVLLSFPPSIFPPITKTITPTTTPLEEKKVVVYAYRDTITGIDPSVEDDTGIMILHLVYETILRYNPETGEYDYVLGKEVKQLDENTWRIILRDDAKFHDGSPVTAYDVNFSIWRTKLLYEKLGRGLGYIWECVDNIVVVDDKTVDIKTAYKCDIRYSLAGAYGAFIYSRKVLELSRINDMLSEDLITWFNQGNALGSGPYKLAKYQPENEVVLEKFENWWGWKIVNNPNAPDVVIIKIVEDPGEQERLLRTGGIDIASSVPRVSLKSLEQAGFKVFVTDTFHNFIIMFNVKRCPTNITEFRKVIAYAIPWDKIVDQALMGYGRKGSGLIPYGFPGYNTKWALRQDLNKARELLNSINIPCKPELKMVITQGYEEEEIFANMLKAELQKIGIQLDIKSLPWEQVKNIGQAVWENPEEAPHIIINDWWPTYLVPYDYFSLLECLEPEKGIINYWNWAGYCNKDFDELLAHAYKVSLSDVKSSLPLYDILQVIVLEDMPALNLWDMQHIYVYNPQKVVIKSKAFNPLYTYTIFFQYVEVLK